MIPIPLTAYGGTGTYLFSASGLPAGMAVSGTSIIKTGDVVVGVYPVTITVNDGSTTDDATFTLTVLAAPTTTPHYSLIDSAEFDEPAPGFDSTETLITTSAYITGDGDTYTDGSGNPYTTGES